jgi:hypothetical protein
MLVSSISFSYEWLTSGGDPAPLRETVAQFKLQVGDVSLTQNEDVWSRTVRDSVLLSVYPLAAWFAASWWRLNFEPLPHHGLAPSVDWRMGHEIGAANCGYVWPQVLFASDGEAIQVWAMPSSPKSRQSIRYLAGLGSPRNVLLADFQIAIDEFIGGVLGRLRAVDQADTDLAHLWSLVLNDRADTNQARLRRIEAQMGFDPEECPDSVITQALELELRMGSAALSELAPVYGRRGEGTALADLFGLASSEGLLGKPEVERSGFQSAHAPVPPWQCAVNAARTLREQLGDSAQPVGDPALYGLLGLSPKTVAEWVPPARYQAGLAIPDHGKGLKFVPRKWHPVGKRFEFARFLADYLWRDGASGDWLTSTDLATSRQKFQRAFAAEFLCPISSVVGFLAGDFTESAIEDAALHYGVSEQTVESLLANNGYIAPRQSEHLFPYRIAAKSPLV